MAYRATRARDEVADRWFDFWRGVDDLVVLGGAASYYGSSHDAGVFRARLSHWSTRRNALGAALRVILSAPENASEARAAYTRAVTSIPGVREEHLHTLLWYRDLIQHELGSEHHPERSPGRRPRRKDGGNDALDRDDALRSLLVAMIALIRRDLWSEPMTPDVLDLRENWRTLVVASQGLERPALGRRIAPS